MGSGWGRRLAGLLALLGFLFAATGSGALPAPPSGRLCSAHGATLPEPATVDDHQCCLSCQLPLAAAVPPSLPQPGDTKVERPRQSPGFALDRPRHFAQARAPPSV